MNVNLFNWSKKWLFAIVGVFALSMTVATAQDAKIFTIKDHSEGGNDKPICRVGRFFSVNPEGKLVWVEQGPFTNSMWYQIPVEGSETDFYLKNVATGQYVYRGYLTEDVEQGDEGFSTKQEMKGWNWDYAYLSSDIEEGKEEYFQFRALPARWGWATDLVNVADAIWDNHGVEANPAFGFVINGQHKFTPGINGDITNVGGDFEYPAAGIMRCTDNGQQGNAWTVVNFNEVAATTEFVKRKVRIEDSGDGGPTSFLGVNVDEENGNSVEWFYTSGKLNVIGDITAWYEIPVSLDEDNLDFYYKNVATGEYLYREGTQKADACGDWCKEPALVASEIDEEAPDYFKFRLIESKWGGRSYLVNVVDANWEAWADKNVDNKRNAGMCITGVGVNWGDWEYPKAWIAGIGDGSNYHGSVIVDIATEVQVFTVTFNKKNGTANEVKQVKEDDKVTKIADPARLDHDFMGWSLVDQKGEKETLQGEDEFEAYDFDEPVTDNFTLFAWWEYAPEPIVERPERKVRILNWGNNVGIDQKFIVYAYLGENEDGELEWIDETPETVNDYTAWIEVPVKGSNYLNYYKNAETGKYMYVSKRLNDEGEILQPLPRNGAWHYEPVKLSEEIDEEIEDYYQFWPILKGDWGGRVHLANMGGVTAENPYAERGAAFYLGPINSNHGGQWGSALPYPKVTTSSLDPYNGNVWASVLIEPVFTQFRIQDYGEGDNPPKFLAVKTTGEGKDQTNEVLWLDDKVDPASDYIRYVWDQLEVAGGEDNDYYYRATTNKNQGQGHFLYREEMDFEGDWGQAQALVSDNYPGTDDYNFRKMESNWGGRNWLVNLADAEFEADGKFVNKKAFVLSGINKDLDWMEPAYPAALMHIMPGKDNIWSSVALNEVGQTRNYIFTINMNGIGGNQNIAIEEGGLANCPIEDPIREGHTFEGWFYDADGTEPYDCEDPDVMENNLTIYAKWEIIPPPRDCTTDIKVVRIGNFQGEAGGSYYPRAYLKCSENGSLMWLVYPDDTGEARPDPGTSNAVFGTFGSDFDPNDETTLWYEIPVPGSNFDKYYKNVAHGRFLILDLEKGAKYPDTYTEKDEDDNEIEKDHPKKGQFMEPWESHEKTDAEPFPRQAWMWRGVKTAAFNEKTAEFKWRRMDTKDWGSQGWGACFLGNAYGVNTEARWGERSAFFALSEHKRLHTGATSPSNVGFPDRYEVFATTLGGDTHLTMGNAWTAAAVWESPDTRKNPDCCQVGGENVECCNGDPACTRPCDGPVCECNPTSAECVEHCFNLNEKGEYDVNCCGKPGYSHTECAVTGIPEIIYLNNLKIFPNPTHNMLIVSGLTGGELITVYTITGQRVLNFVATGDQAEFSVTHLPKGTYIVKVSYKTGEFSTKFIVN